MITFSDPVEEKIDQITSLLQGEYFLGKRTTTILSRFAKRVVRKIKKSLDGLEEEKEGDLSSNICCRVGAMDLKLSKF